MMKRMKCQSRLSHFGLLLLVVAAAAVELVSCVEYVTLKGTEASTPLMKCSEKKFAHNKLDGEPLDIEQLSGKDDSVLIIKSEKVEGGEEGEKEYTLQIKLTKDISENNHHLFIGEWKCGDDSWIVKGDPYIERLTLDWDTEEKHRLSATVNEGTDVKLSCDAFVIAEEGVEPQIIWDILPEEGVTDGPQPNITKWVTSDLLEISKNHWRSNYTFQGEGGITKDDRFSYKCTVKVGEFERSDSMLLRVKGKYAVLWPTIGILIEVLLLGVGTWLYEKRKSKAAAASAEAKDGDSGAAVVDPVQPSSSTGAVRKRTNVNT